MKKIIWLPVIAIGVLLLFERVANAQTFERNAKESSDDFVRRIFPSDASMQFKTVENKFGTPVKKIIYFSKKLAMDTSINKDEKIDCLYANILIPESETSNKYSLQTLLIGCNTNYAAQIENAYADKDKQKNQVLSISFCQLNRASTRLILKNYSTFYLRQTVGSNTFTIEEIKE